MPDTSDFPSDPRRRPEFLVTWPRLPQPATLVHFSMSLGIGLVAVLWKMVDLVPGLGALTIAPMGLVLAVIAYLIHKVMRLAKEKPAVFLPPDRPTRSRTEP